MALHSVVQTASGVTSVPIQILEASDARRCIIFSPPTAGSYTVSTSSSVTSGAGVTMSAASTALTFSSDTHGDIVRKAWYAVASGCCGPSSIGFVVVIEG